METLRHTQMKAKTFHRHYCASPPSDRLINLPLHCSPESQIFIGIDLMSSHSHHRLNLSLFPGSTAPMRLWFIVLSNSYMYCILCVRCKNAIHLKLAAAERCSSSAPPLDSRTPVKESICKGTFYKLYQHDGFHLLSLCSFVQLDFSISISGIDFYFYFLCK